MPTDDGQLPEEAQSEPTSSNPEPSDPQPLATFFFSECDRGLLLTYLFDLAAQQTGRYRRLDSESLSHEIGLLAFDQMSRQPSAREKVATSLRNGTDEWKRVANRCVLHARAEIVKRELEELRRRANVPVEQLEPPELVSAFDDELFAEVRKCVSMLNAVRQAVIHLRIERRLTFQEIAIELSWSRSRVFGCFAAALVQLARLLQARE